MNLTRYMGVATVRPMRHASARFLLLFFSLAALGSPAQGQLSSIETGNIRLVYFDPSLTYLSSHVGRCVENALAFDKKLFSYRPSGKVTVFLNDFGDTGNAAATGIPRPFVKVDVAPLSFAFETVVANERMNFLINHEMVHLTASDQAAGSDRFFRSLFRGAVSPVPAQPESIFYFYLTSPRNAVPRWYSEGLAVFIETWMAGGQGRAQGAYDEMVFRSLVKDQGHIYDPLGLVSEGVKVDFQTGVNSYLYGGRFMSYLALKHGPESVVRWGARTDGSRAYYASQFEHVYGQSLDNAWKEWIDFEHGFQEKNLAAIREHPLTPAADLSKQALGSVSRAYYDPLTRSLYAGLNYPGTVSHLGAISVDTGAVRKLGDIKGPLLYTVTSLAWDPDRRRLFYTTDNGSYRDLRQLDPETGESRELLKDARIGELVFDRSDHSLFGLRVLNGITTLVQIHSPYKEFVSLYSWPYGEVPYDLDVSPDGTLLAASLGDVTGRQSLRIMKTEALRKGDATPQASFDFGTAIPSNFVFSSDGQRLYGSSYYTGVSNIFRYDVATQKLDAVSNTDSGFFRPIPIEGDDLIVFRYTGDGFLPTRIKALPLQDVNPITFLGQQVAERHPIVDQWKLGSPASIPIESLITQKGRYHSLRAMRLESIFPVVQGYKDFGAIGARAEFSDVLMLNHASLTGSYTPNAKLPADERYHLQGEFKRYDWSLGFQVNGADFYDLVGPTRTSLKGYAVGVGYDKSLLYDAPRQMTLKLDATYYGNLDRIPDFQDVPTNFTDTLSTRARLSYKDTRHSLGYVDEEKGVAWNVTLGGDRVKGDYFPRLSTGLDLGVQLPLSHSSVWFRSAAGWAHGDRAEPFANFYFGGFGNNWVDHRDEKRYRESFAFPGIAINELSGTSFAKAMVEWNLPPLRFERAGTPGLYLTWARPALFTTALVLNPDRSAFRRTIVNVGSQVDFRLTLLSRLDLTLSAGYARAFEQGQRSRSQWMFSLKIL